MSEKARERLGRLIWKHFPVGSSFGRADAWRSIRHGVVNSPEALDLVLSEFCSEGILREEVREKGARGRPPLPNYTVLKLPPEVDFDEVDRPSHYLGTNGIEAIDTLRATTSPHDFKVYCVLTARTYLWRAGQKGEMDEDVRKAVTYLQHALQ